MVYERYLVNFWTHWSRTLNSYKAFSVQMFLLTVLTIENLDEENPWFTFEWARQKKLALYGIEEDNEPDPE